jgi:hypothetical protein
MRRSRYQGADCASFRRCGRRLRRLKAERAFVPGIVSMQPAMDARYALLPSFEAEAFDQPYNENQTGLVTEFLAFFENFLQFVADRQQLQIH